VSRADHQTTTRRRLLSGIVPSVLGAGLAGVLLAGCGSGQITQTESQQPVVNGASGNVGSIAIRNTQLAYPGNANGVYAPGSTARLIVTIVNSGGTDDTLTRVTTPAAGQVLVDGSPTGSKLIPGGFSVSSGVDVDDESVPNSASVQPGISSAPATTPSIATPPSGPASPSSGAQSPSSGGASIPATPPSAPNGSVPATPPSSQAPRLPGSVTIDVVQIRSVNGGSLRAGLTIPMTFYFAHAGQVTLVQVPIAAPADNAS
jgi:hypothetical protein